MTTILHRMQRVIQVFLQYHGYEVGRWLLARPETGRREEGPQDFWVRVRMHPEVLMGEGGDGGAGAKGGAAGGLGAKHCFAPTAWVLWALFVYAEEIDLNPSPFR